MPILNIGCSRTLMALIELINTEFDNKEIQGIVDLISMTSNKYELSKI